MKFIVFFFCLFPLLQHCLISKSSAIITKTCSMGTALCVRLLCKLTHISTWYSQPITNNVFLGNLLVTSLIVFSGGTFKSFQDFAAILRNDILFATK